MSFITGFFAFISSFGTILKALMELIKLGKAMIESHQRIKDQERLDKINKAIDEDNTAAIDAGLGNSHQGVSTGFGDVRKKPGSGGVNGVLIFICLLGIGGCKDQQKIEATVWNTRQGDGVYRDLPGDNEEFIGFNDSRILDFKAMRKKDIKELIRLALKRCQNSGSVKMAQAPGLHLQENQLESLDESALENRVEQIYSSIDSTNSYLIP